MRINLSMILRMQQSDFMSSLFRRQCITAFFLMAIFSSQAAAAPLRPSNTATSYDEFKKIKLDSLDNEIKLQIQEYNGLKRKIRKAKKKVNRFLDSHTHLDPNKFNIIIPEFYCSGGKSEPYIYKINNYIKQILLQRTSNPDVVVALYPKKFGQVHADAGIEVNDKGEWAKVFGIAEDENASLVLWGSAEKTMKSNQVNLRITAGVLKSRVAILYSYENMFTERASLAFTHQGYVNVDNTKNVKDYLKSALDFTFKLIAVEHHKKEDSIKGFQKALFELNIMRLNKNFQYNFTRPFEAAVWAETIFLNFELYRKCGTTNRTLYERAISELEGFQNLQDRWAKKVNNGNVLSYLLSYKEYIIGGQDKLQSCISRLEQMYYAEANPIRCYPVASLLLEAYIAQGDSKDYARALMDEFHRDDQHTLNDERKLRNRYVEAFNN